MKYLLFGLWLLSIGAVRSEDVLFDPKYADGRVGWPDWTAVCSHLPVGTLKIELESVEGQPFSKAVTFNILSATTKEHIGKPAYVRSAPVLLGSDHLIVEWWENVVDGVDGPTFELWGKVGTKPNDRDNLALTLGRTQKGIVFGKDILVEVKPGWRHFKVVANTSTNTFDFYSDDMSSAVSKDMPLLSVPEKWNHPGIGFILYLVPNVEPLKIQLGGIRISES